jgi:hypothetical protein
MATLQPPVEAVEVGATDEVLEAVLVATGVVVATVVVDEPMGVDEATPLGTVHEPVPSAVAQSSVAPLA